MGLKKGEWLDRKLKKSMLKIQRKKKEKKEQGLEEYYKISKGEKFEKKSSHKLKKYTINAPQNFTFRDNYIETVKVLNDLIEIKNKSEFKSEITLDTSETKFVDVEVLMYLIAIITDMNAKIFNALKFKGILPNDKNAEAIFKYSGFMNYVNYKGKIKPLDDRIQIKVGKKNNPQIAKEICDFIKEKCGVKNTTSLYNVLNELMQNAIQHAYSGKDFQGDLSATSWYIYVEEKEEYVRCVLLDTGVGIPKTMNKKIMEKIIKNDSELIELALQGDFRSATKQSFRGNGLPELVIGTKDGILSKTSVYSNKGYCEILEDGNFKLENNTEKIPGTLINWVIKKERRNECN